MWSWQSQRQQRSSQEWDKARIVATDWLTSLQRIHWLSRKGLTISRLCLLTPTPHCSTGRAQEHPHLTAACGVCALRALVYLSSYVWNNHSSLQCIIDFHWGYENAGEGDSPLVPSPHEETIRARFYHVPKKVIHVIPYIPDSIGSNCLKYLRDSPGFLAYCPGYRKALLQFILLVPDEDQTLA